MEENCISLYRFTLYCDTQTQPTPDHRHGAGDQQPSDPWYEIVIALFGDPA